MTRLLGEGKGRTDWARIDAMTEEEIDRMAEEDPDTIPESGFFEGRVILPPKKESVHIRLDADMLEWFRANSDRYQTYMNSVLRKWYETKSRQQS